MSGRAVSILETYPFLDSLWVQLFVCLLPILWRVANRWIKGAKLRTLTAQKQAQMLTEWSELSKLYASIPDSDLQVSSPGSVFKMNVAELHHAYLSGWFTVRRVLDLYLARTLRKCTDLNLVISFMHVKAFKLAEERDKQLKPLVEKYKKLDPPEQERLLKELPPLFGVPISVKDVFDVENYDTTMGSGQNLAKPAPKDGLVIQLLLQAGAVPWVKTSAPQMLLINETHNWIRGRAKNPWDTDRSTGGSSGGDAGLVSFGCSFLGIGSDGGGSVRIPANYCGLVGIRPTAKRFTIIGHKSTSAYTPRHIFGCAGPLGRSMEDCERMLIALQNRTLLDVQDGLLPPLVWNQQISNEHSTKKLRIGMFRTFPQMCDTCDSVANMMEETAKILKKAGHEVVEFDIEPDLLRRLVYYFARTAIMNHPRRIAEIGAEPEIPEFKLVATMSKVPTWLKTIVGFVLSHIPKFNRYSQYLRLEIPNKTRQNLFETINHQFMDSEMFFKKMTDMKLDCLVSPGFPVPAVKHGDSKTISNYCMYTFLQNLLDLPSVALPVRLVRTGEEGYKDRWIPDDLFEQAGKNTTEGSAGLPIGIQVSCLPYEDEKVCGIAKQLEKIFKFPYLPLERINQYKPDVTAAK